MKGSADSKSQRKLTRSMSRRVSEDRISDLPDSVVQHILSLLDAKDAFRTCLLSKRWENLWTSIPNLLFRCESYEREEVRRFASFVDKFLTKHASSKIKKFALDFCTDHTSENQVNSWLRFAVNHKAEDLRLQRRVREDGPYKWPDFMYTNSSVSKMELHSIWIEESLKGFHWKSLKALSLSHSTLTDDTIRSILLGSPLEFLSLQRCKLDDYWSQIDASNTSLRELIIDGYMGEMTWTQINILGTNLQSLTAVNFQDKLTFNFVDVSSLMEATVDFYVGLGLLTHKQEMELLTSLIQNLSHVEKLTIGICYFQKYFGTKAIQARFLTIARDALEIDMESTKGYLPGLVALLYSYPDVEQLTFKKEGCYVEKPLRPAVKPCPIQRLKRIKVMGFPAGSSSSSDKVIAEMVEHLLANSKVLQRLIICGFRSDKPRTQSRLLRIMNKLQSFPRASPDAVLIFQTDLL